VSRGAWRCEPGPRGQRGFTLLEITIAMSFVALLATGIAISISTCLNVWNRAVETADLNQEARAMMELISRDIRGATLGLDRASGYFRLSPALEGEAPFDLLEVSTSSSSASRVGLLPDELRSLDQESRPPVTDYMGVGYAWREADLEGPAGLYRVTTVVPARVMLGTQTPFAEYVNAELVSDAVTKLRFLCYDGNEWVPEWNAPFQVNQLPAAVSVELTILDAREREHEFRTIVPIAVR